MAPNPTEALRKVLVSSGVVGVEVFSNDWIWGQGNRNWFVWENFGSFYQLGKLPSSMDGYYQLCLFDCLFVKN